MLHCLLLETLRKLTHLAVFTKLASQLNADKLAELAVIPFIFIAQTIVSFLCAKAISYAFRFKKRQSNFVIAMGVCIP